MDYNKLRNELDKVVQDKRKITPETWHLDGVGNRMMSVIRDWLKEEVE